ncbi:MAG: hypothetical protein U0T77_04385 [Chitinophagales bacterium]
MQPIKVIELLEKLDISDLERLGELLKYRNRRPEYVCLFNEIVSNIIHQKVNTKEQLWKTVYGKQPLNNNQFRKLCFDLLQDIEQTLGLLYVDKNDVNKTILLLQYLSRHTIGNTFEEKWERLQKQIKQTDKKLNSTGLYLKYEMQNCMYEYLVNNPAKSKLNNILSVSDTLDDYYILQKLKFICHAINESKFTTYNSLPRFNGYVIEMANDINSENKTLIDFYLSIYRLFTSPASEKPYDIIKQQLENSDLIDESERRIIFQYVINFCILELNSGNQHFESELFDIYKTYIRKIEDKIFSPFRFKNIINLSLKLKQYSFAGSFIDKYGKKLPSEQQQTVIAFNKAKLNYELKKYDDVIDTLQNIKTSDLTFNLSSKVLLVKTFYEKKEFIFLESFLETFRVYVLRNRQINTSSKKNYFDFIKNCKKLIALDVKSKKEIDQFTIRIIKHENLSDKNWLLEKLASI